MPTPVDKLSPNSSDKEIRDAISGCIDIEMEHGKKQSVAIAACFSMAADKTGKKISHGGE